MWRRISKRHAHIEAILTRSGNARPKRYERLDSSAEGLQAKANHEFNTQQGHAELCTMCCREHMPLFDPRFRGYGKVRAARLLQRLICMWPHRIAAALDWWPSGLHPAIPLPHGNGGTARSGDSFVVCAGQNTVRHCGPASGFQVRSMHLCVRQCMTSTPARSVCTRPPLASSTY